MPLHDVSGATSGQLVESLLMNAASQNNIIIPNKPRGEEVGMREEDQIQGAYVKLPSPGIYENIAVFDFRSLYPSILITYNVGPDTLNCGHEECKKGRNISPSGHYFCMKRLGLVPLTMKGLFERRKAAKAQLKTVSKEGQTALNARVAAMKIILNATIGMFRYVRARWYSRECAEAIVSGWARFYVQDVAQKAEKAGYDVLYADTDSTFLLLGDKTEGDAMRFMQEINKDLPEAMELELEDFYSRGVFVAKKQEKGTKGAKKKYALINKEGKIKIRGFELVRRDWSKVARDAQRRVLEAILIDGSKEKAMEIVKDVVQHIKDGEIGKDELVIYTQLRKKNYEIMSPELAAADKARKRGMKISTGAIIGYVITRSGKSISEKAELAQYANDYDPDYYINNQVIPAVLRILGELGYTEDDIKYIGKQSSLGGWM
jgi:DNA polymerase I